MSITLKEARMMALQALNYFDELQGNKFRDARFVGYAWGVLVQIAGESDRVPPWGNQVEKPGAES